MSVRSKQLAATTYSDGSEHAIYTVPASHRTIVKSIIIESAQTSAAHISVTIKSGATALSVMVVDCAAFNTNGATAFVNTWFVLEAGQTLYVQFASSGGWITVSGAELAL